MTTQPFNNSASQSERQALLRQDRKTSLDFADALEKADQRRKERQPSTLFREATKSRTLSGGSYEAERDTIVAGEGQAVIYPRLPPGNPWSGDPVGLEPPTNIDINALEPTGTPMEIAASLDEFANPAITTARRYRGTNDLVGGVGDPLAASTGPLSSESTPSPAYSAAGADPGAAIQPRLKRRRL